MMDEIMNVGTKPYLTYLNPLRPTQTPDPQMSITTTRFITLFPLLFRPHPHRFIRVFTKRHRHLNRFLSPPQAPSLSSTHLFTTHSLKLDQPHYSDSEWFHFLNRVSYNGSIQHFDDFVDDFKFQLPLDVFRVSNRCLAFARARPHLLWSLPREDIEVVVENVSPALFKDGSGSATRMKMFLGCGSSDVFNSEKPATVDLMRFLLSYAGMKIISSESILIDNKVESAVRKLFSELAKSSEMSVKFATSVENQAPEGHGRTLRSFGKNIEMKRGDWICPRCDFMNFAKNHKCLECDEPRPVKYVTGKEWECPQCNFFNFGKNVTCLRCDCKNLIASPNQSPDFISGSATNSSYSRANVERSAKVEERQQSWFTKIKQLELSSDTSNSVTDADFLVAKITKDLGSHRKSDFGTSQTLDLESDINIEFSQHLDEALGEKSSSTHINSGDSASSTLSSFNTEDGFPETMPLREGENRFVVSKKKDRSLTSPMYKRRIAMDQGGNNNYVPFVPFPPDYFATDKPKDGSEMTSVPSNNDMDQTSKSSDSQLKSSYPGGNSPTTSKNETDFNGVSRESSENQSPRDIWRGMSLEGSAVKEPDPLDMSEEAKAERWFRRVAQIKDISELSQIPDEDFPSIMPMRKGVNRFVVSKRKTPLERRLTSSKYQRNRSIQSSDPLKTENDSS